MAAYLIHTRILSREGIVTLETRECVTPDDAREWAGAMVDPINPDVIDVVAHVGGSAPIVLRGPAYEAFVNLHCKPGVD